MKKNQTRSKELIEKSDYWKWNDNMCFNGVYCNDPNCKYDHPIVDGKPMKGEIRRYKPQCSRKGDNTKLNKFGYELLMKYENSCPGKSSKESREKFWNNYCDTLDNPVDIINQGQQYQECADNREIYAQTCTLLPDNLDVSHFKTSTVMNNYAKDCRKKVRAINFRNDRKKNSKKQTKRKILDTLRTIKSVYPRKVSDERWSKMFKSPSTRSKSGSKSTAKGKTKKTCFTNSFNSPRSRIRKTGKKTTRGPIGPKKKK